MEGKSRVTLQLTTSITNSSEKTAGKKLKPLALDRLSNLLVRLREAWVFPLILILAQSSSDNTVFAVERLKIASSTVNIFTTPLWLAKEKGFFFKHGLEVEQVYIASGTMAVQTLLGGDVQVVVGGGSAAVNAKLKGASVKIIGGMVNYYPGTFFVTPDIRGPKDLRGKKIAVSRIGSSSHTATVMLLRKFGLEEGKDYGVVQFLGATQNRLIALEKGIIQGTTLNAPESIRAKNAGMKVLSSPEEMKELGIALPHIAMVVTEKYLHEFRPVIKSFLKAYLEGVREGHSDKEATMQVLSKHTRITDPQVLSASYDENYPLIDKEGKATEEAIEVVLRDLGRKDHQALTAKPSRFLDLSLLEELSREGFIKAIWSKTK